MRKQNVCRWRVKLPNNEGSVAWSISTGDCEIQEDTHLNVALCGVVVSEGFTHSRKEEEEEEAIKHRGLKEDTG